MSILVGALIIVSIFIWINYSNEKARKEAQELARKAREDRIYQKYGHNEIAERIIKGTIWVGETSEQLMDSLGNPIDIDESVLKTKKKEVWKYCQKSANRFGYRIKLENSIVVGWDEKM